MWRARRSGSATCTTSPEAVPYLVALNPSAVELLDRTLLDVVRESGAPPTCPRGSKDSC